MRTIKFKPVETTILLILIGIVIGSIGTLLHYFMTGQNICLKLETEENCKKRGDDYLHKEFRNTYAKLIVDCLNLVMIIITLVLINLFKNPKQLRIPMLLLIIIFSLSTFSLSTGISSTQQDQIYLTNVQFQRDQACKVIHENKLAFNNLKDNKDNLNQTQQFQLQGLLKADKACYYLDVYIDSFDKYCQCALPLTIITLILSFSIIVYNLFYAKHYNYKVEEFNVKNSLPIINLQSCPESQQIILKNSKQQSNILISTVINHDNKNEENDKINYENKVSS